MTSHIDAALRALCVFWSKGEISDDFFISEAITLLAERRRLQGGRA